MSLCKIGFDGECFLKLRDSFIQQALIIIGKGKTIISFYITGKNG